MNHSSDEISSDAGADPLPGTAMTRIARWSIAHRWLVVGGWVILTVLGGLAASRVSDRLSPAFDLPGQPGYAANEEILRLFGNGGHVDPLVAVVHLTDGSTVDDDGVREELRVAFDAGVAALPGARYASWVSTGDRAFVSDDGATTFAFYYPVPEFASNDPYATALPTLRDALADRTVAGEPVLVTGSTILSTGGESEGNSVLVETLFAATGALVVLGVVFGSLLAFLPLLIAAVAIPSAFLLIWGLTAVTDLSSLVQNIVALIGLGVAIDYALLIVTRWREERAAGSGNRDAVLRAATTAGESVLFSGLTVAVSLAALVLTTVPFLRSVGIAGLLIPLLSVAVSATLLPVVLDLVGPRLEWPRRRPVGTVSPLWTRIATLVVRHRFLAAGGALAVLAVLIAPVFSINLGEPRAEAMAATAPAEARAGLEALTGSGSGSGSGPGAGVLRPTAVILPADIDGLPPREGITSVAPGDWVADGVRVVAAWSPADASGPEGKAALDVVRAAAAEVPGARVGGTPAEDGDFIDALYGRNLVVILGAIVLVTTVLLARALRSLWLPVKALLLNLLSLAAAFGVLTFVWQEGHGTQAVFGAPATGAVTLWVPLAVFALLFGLSMDYEVFILTRINEEYAAGHDTDTAVVRGISHTGRLVTSGALILCLAFIALGGVPQTDVKILSTGLAVGVILDATIIRGVLAPALVAMLGRYNWWLPGPVARVLRIDPLRRGGT